MNRRSFLRRVTPLVASAAASAPVVATPGLPRFWPTLQDPLAYHGYLLHWTGWKGSQEHALLFGQWLAWPVRGFGVSDVSDRPPYLYVGVPGFVGGPYRPGAVFVLYSPGDRFVGGETSRDVADGWITEGQSYIQQLVDQYRRTVARELTSFPLVQFPDGTPF